MKIFWTKIINWKKKYKIIWKKIKNEITIIINNKKFYKNYNSQYVRIFPSTKKFLIPT